MSVLSVRLCSDAQASCGADWYLFLLVTHSSSYLLHNNYCKCFRILCSCVDSVGVLSTNITTLDRTHIMAARIITIQVHATLTAAVLRNVRLQHLQCRLQDLSFRNADDRGNCHLPTTHINSTNLCSNALEEEIDQALLPLSSPNII